MTRYSDEMRQHAAVLFAEIKSADENKKAVSIKENEDRLTAIYKGYLSRCGVAVGLQIRFADVHALMGFKGHTELAYVKLDGRNIELLFHPRIIEFSVWDAGFVFVYKCWVLLLVILRALELDGALKGEFVFEAGDNGEFESVSFCSRQPSACLILDDEFARSAGYEEFRREVATSDKPWRDRQARFFWRGATTGRRLAAPAASSDAEDWGWLQRLRLCREAFSGPDAAVCDVGITQIVQIGEPELVERIKQSGFMKPFVPRTKFVEQKFLFDIDGNSNAWAGLYCALYTGSCVVKIGSYFGYKQWYYDLLLPWKNYAPVDRELRDLHDVIQWLVSHDSEAEEIGRHGRDLAKSITIDSAVETSAQNFLSWLARRARGG